MHGIHRPRFMLRGETSNDDGVVRAARRCALLLVPLTVVVGTGRAHRGGRRLDANGGAHFLDTEQVGVEAVVAGAAPRPVVQHRQRKLRERSALVRERGHARLEIAGRVVQAVRRHRRAAWACVGGFGIAEVLERHADDVVDDRDVGLASPS